MVWALAMLCSALWPVQGAGGTFSQNPGLGDPPPTAGPPGAETAGSVSSSAAAGQEALWGLVCAPLVWPTVKPVLTAGTWPCALGVCVGGVVSETQSTKMRGVRGLLPGRLAGGRHHRTLNPLPAASAPAPGACWGLKQNMDSSQCPCPMKGLGSGRGEGPGPPGRLGARELQARVLAVPGGQGAHPGTGQRVRKWRRWVSGQVSDRGTVPPHPSHTLTLG